MELRQLTYFLAIAENSTMSDAAKKLHVSQPAMSAALKDLERELGFPLFDRVGKRLHINKYGVYFAQRVHKIFATLEDTQTTIKKSISERENTIHCRVNMPLGKVGKAIFHGFHQAYPEVTVQVGFYGTALFDADSCDLEFFGSTEALIENNRAISLGFERFLLVIPAENPLATKSPLYLKDFREEPFIFGEASAMRTALDSMFEEAGFKPRVAGELQLYGDVLQLVRAGMGCAFAAEFSWFDRDDDNEFVVRQLDDVQRGRTIYARIPDDVVPSAATEKFFQYLKEHRAEFIQ